MPSRPSTSTRNRGPGRGKYDRSKSVRERREERHQRLIRAAGQVFAAKGRTGASVSDIVDAAGVSRQTFYEHFENVLDCLIQVYDHSVNVTFRGAEQTLRAIEDPVERLKVGVEGYLAGMGRNPDLTMVLHRGSLAAGPEYIARREASYARWVALMMEGVAEAYARGVVTRPPDEQTAYVLISGMETLALRYIDRGEADRITEAAPRLTELVLRAFGGDPEAAGLKR